MKNSAADVTFATELTQLISHLRAFARSLCGDATFADDLAQDTVAKAWQCRDSFEAGTNMKAWTFMILRNQFYSDRRRAWRWEGLDPEVAAKTLVATSDPTAGLYLDEVRRALACLPETQREALVLIGAGGLSYEEAAEICGVAIGTVKSRVSRARDQLAVVLAEGSMITDGQPPSQALEGFEAEVASLRRQAAA
ncbi:MAG TPA: sigma-70 family RNA polymerase sigma factor [Phenylobacterium sp.]